MNENPKIETAVPSAESSDKSQLAKNQRASVRARLVEKIRSELNIEKWPAIWQPAKSKNRPTLRTMQREVTTDDGNRMVSRVEVGFTQLGTLTTEEQKLLYVLIKLWEDADKPDAQVFFSTRGLARMLKKKGWGTNVIHSVTKSLRKLRTIPIEWINSYFEQTQNGAVVVDRRPFTILGDLRIVEKRQDGAINTSRGYFKFDDRILSNLLRNYTKPVCIEEFFKLTSEIAQLVYTHIDLVLFDKTKYERRSRELFDDLGLTNPEYNHMFERRRALERALKELAGIQLSSGVLRAATIEKTRDGKDYKVSFQKMARSDVAVGRLEAPAAIIVHDYSKQKDPLFLEAEDLVRYFHKIFHGVEAHLPQSKETNQALSLISQHGSARSRSVVDFAHQEAQKTNYQIQHFGAVLSYTSRALAATVESSHNTQRRAPRQHGRQAEPEKSWTKGEERLTILTELQRTERFAQAKAVLFAENSFFASNWTESSLLHQRFLRSRVIQRLDEEIMDLIPFDPMLLVVYPWYARSQNLDL